MANYKNQHLIPQIYLKNFIEKKDNINSKYENGLYVIDKKFYNSKNKSIKNKPFSKSYCYTLENEDKDNPIIEKYLSTIEAQYTRVLENILNKNISKEGLFFISYFTLIQHLRVEKSLNSFQNSMDELSEMVNNIYSVDIGEDTKEIAKKMLLNFEEEKETNSVFEQGVSFIENDSQENFIISDTPVVHRMFHIDELQNILGNINIEYSNDLPRQFKFKVQHL